MKFFKDDFMFESLSTTPPDAIIGMIALANADKNPNKIDLGVGIYQDDHGDTPVMRAVKAAERAWLDEEDTKKYIAIHGNPQFNDLFSELVFGADHPVLGTKRLALAQAAGGSGALRLGAEVLKLANPGATVWVSTPTWANHVPLVTAAGLPIKQYPYYDHKTLAVDFAAMCKTLRDEAKAGDAVLLHGSCHNPTGADLTPNQWEVIGDLMLEKELLPYVDLSYMGLGDGLDADAFGLRHLAGRFDEMLIAVSCSKNFGLYRERVGMVGVIAKTPQAAELAHGQLGLLIRRMISMPPDHGAALVAKILATPALRSDWLDELETMRLRMRDLRVALSDTLAVQGAEVMAAAIKRQNGMFSLLPVTPAQAERLRSEFSVYLLNSGRINIGGARLETIPRLADCILAVL
jgi:aspartate aminotransferase